MQMKYFPNYPILGISFFNPIKTFLITNASTQNFNNSFNSPKTAKTFQLNSHPLRFHDKSLSGWFIKNFLHIPSSPQTSPCDFSLSVCASKHHARYRKYFTPPKPAGNPNNFIYLSTFSSPRNFLAADNRKISLHKLAGVLSKSV
jgi:hypothetical protein